MDAVRVRILDEADIVRRNALAVRGDWAVLELLFSS